MRKLIVTLILGLISYLGVGQINPNQIGWAIDSNYVLTSGFVWNGAYYGTWQHKDSLGFGDLDWIKNDGTVPTDTLDDIHTWGKVAVQMLPENLFNVAYQGSPLLRVDTNLLGYGRGIDYTNWQSTPLIAVGDSIVTAYGTDNFYFGNRIYNQGTLTLVRDRNIVIGNDAYVQGLADDGIVIGSGSYLYYADDGQVVIGNNSGGAGAYSVSIGTNNDDPGNYGTAIGYNVTGGYRSVALGHTAKATGQESLAQGYLSSSAGLYSFALGRQNTVVSTGEGSGAVGFRNTARGPYTYLYGDWLESSAGHEKAMLLGSGVHNTNRLYTIGDTTFSIGLVSTNILNILHSEGPDGSRVGLVTTTPTRTLHIGGDLRIDSLAQDTFDRILIADNLGNVYFKPEDSLSIAGSGGGSDLDWLEAGGTAPDDSLDNVYTYGELDLYNSQGAKEHYLHLDTGIMIWGRYNTYTDTDTSLLILGPGNSVDADAFKTSIVGGYNSITDARYMTVHGWDNTITGSNTSYNVVLGHRNNLLGGNSGSKIAIGRLIDDVGNNGVAIGYSPQAGPQTVAIGYNVIGTGQQSIGLGYAARVTNNNAVTVGASSQNSGIASTIVGGSSLVYSPYSTSVGYSNYLTNTNYSVTVGYDNHGTTWGKDYHTSIGAFLSADHERLVLIGQGLDGGNRSHSTRDSSIQFVMFDSTLITSVYSANYQRTGINTDQPTKELDIAGELRIREIPQDTFTKALVVDPDGNVHYNYISGGGGGTDDQTVDTFAVIGDTIYLALEDDNEDLYKIPISDLDDGDWVISGSDQYSGVSGNVGIGISTPGQKLHVKDGNGKIVTTNSAGALLIQDDGGQAGHIDFGNNTASIGLSNDGLSGGYDYDGTFVFKQKASNPDDVVEFLFIEESGDWRFALPSSGAGRGTYNPRSMIIAGPSPNIGNATLNTYWDFNKVDMNTSVTGADLGVQDDLEVLGTSWLHEGVIMEERASAPQTNDPGFGQWWVKNESANTPYFTDDAGVDWDLRDNQVIDTFTRTGNTIYLSLEDDGEAAKTITLPVSDNYNYWTLEDDLAQQFQVSSEDELLILGGTNITTELDGNELTITNTYNWDIEGDTGSDQILSGTTLGVYGANGIITSVAPDVELQIEGDTNFLATKSYVDLNESDDQTVDTFSLDGTTLSLTLEDDNEAPYAVDLSPLQDGTGTDDQTIDQFEIGSNILSLSLEDDGEAAKTVDLTPYLDNTDDQTVDKFHYLAGWLYLSLEDDGEADKAVDLTPLATWFADGDGGPQVTITTNDILTIEGGFGIETVANGFQYKVTTHVDSNVITTRSYFDENESDDQTVDSLYIDGSNNLTITLEDDNEAPYQVDLSSFLDNTDDQAISISNDTIYLEDGGYVVLPTGTVDTDDQTVDSFYLDGTDLVITLEDDNEAPYIVDLSTLATDDGDWTVSGSDIYNQNSANVRVKNQLHVGEDRGASDAQIKLGINRTSDGNSYLDLVSEGTGGTYTSYGLRLIRNSGVAGNSQITHRGAGDLRIVANEATSDINVITGGVSRMFFQNGGSLGIGTTTPEYKIHSKFTNSKFLIEDNSNTSAAPAIEVLGNRSDGNTSPSFAGKLLLTGRRTNDTIGVGKALGVIGFGGPIDPNSNTTYLGASIYGAAGGNWGVDTIPTDIRFATGYTPRLHNTANVTFGDVRMIIKYDGSVGIATTSPTAKLDVNGETRLRALSQENTWTRLVVADANGNLEYRDETSLNYFDGFYTSLDFTGTTGLSDGVDDDTQDLSISGHTLSLTNSPDVILPTSGVGTADMAYIRLTDSSTTNINASATNNIMAWNKQQANDYTTIFNHNESTNNSRVGVFEDGNYMITGAVNGESSINNVNYKAKVKLRVNGSTTYDNQYVGVHLSGTGDDHETSLYFHFIVTLDANDYFEILVDRIASTSTISKMSEESTLNCLLLKSAEVLGSGGDNWGSQYVITSGSALSGQGTSASPLTVNVNDADSDATNEAWTIDGDDADTELITNQTVKFEGSGIVTTDYDPVLNELIIDGTETDPIYSGDPASTITNLDISNWNDDDVDDADSDPTNEFQDLSWNDGTNQVEITNGTNATITGFLESEVDGSVTNEAWTIDGDDADTELISNQTVKFEGAGSVTTNYNPATNTMVITGAAGSETDPIFTASPAYSITNTQITNWDNHLSNDNDLSATNEAWTITGDNAVSELIANQTVDFAGGSNISTSYSSTLNTLTITNDMTWSTLPGIPAGFADNVDNVDDADASATNEAWTIEADAGPTELVDNDIIDFVGGTDISTSYNSTLNELTIAYTGSSGADADWYEVGTSTPPDAITDNQYTQGDVNIGTSTATGHRLNIYDNTTGNIARFRNANSQYECGIEVWGPSIWTYGSGSDGLFKIAEGTDVNSNPTLTLSLGDRLGINNDQPPGVLSVKSTSSNYTGPMIDIENTYSGTSNNVIVDMLAESNIDNDYIHEINFEVRSDDLPDDPTTPPYQSTQTVTYDLVEFETFRPYDDSTHAEFVINVGLEKTPTPSSPYGGSGGERLRIERDGALQLPAYENDDLVTDGFQDYNVAVDDDGELVKTGQGQLPIISKAVNYTATIKDHTILVDADLGNRTITLPTGSEYQGKVFTVKKTSSSGNAYVSSTGLLDGSSADITLDTQWEFVTLQYYNGNYYIISKNY